MKDNIAILGIDLSLTSTGVVELILPSKDIARLQTNSRVVKSKYKAEARLEDIRSQVMATIETLEPQLTVIEGYAFGRPNQMAALGELSGLIKHNLHVNGWDFIVIPPTRGKKFACGKGNAKKDEVRLGVYKRWGFEAPTNDEVDAYVLARIGLAYLGFDSNLIKAQQEVIDDMKKGK